MLFVRILCKNTSTLAGFLFCWMTVLRRILTSDNLRKRSFIIVEWHCMCRCIEETMDHLLIHCEGAHWLWSVIFRSFSVSWVYQMRAVVFLDRETFVSLEPLYVSWIIWRELILEHSGTWRVGPAYSLVFRHLV